MAASPQRVSPLTTFVVGVGLLCCIYLAALKLINLPCPLTGCGEIINSRFGAIFGVPLPILAMPLWIAGALAPTREWQRGVQLACVLALAAGGIVLMGIQFLVLKGFCPFCTLHALAAVTAAIVLPLRGRAHAWLPALMLALTLPLVLVVKTVAEAQLRPSAVVPTAVSGAPNAAVSARPALPANIDQAAFRWLGEIDPKGSPILVVSFQCSHCLSLLEQTLSNPGFGVLRGPKVFVYAQPHESDDSVAVIAAILSVPGSPVEQFSAVFGHLDELREPLLTHDSKDLRKRLAALFPGYTEKLPEARRLFNVQVVALKFIPGKGSPFLLMPDGTSTYGAVASDLLFH